MASILSVNLAVPRDNTFRRARLSTGIDKRPVEHPVEVRAPGSRAHGLGSGLVGDHIGDRRHHGGDEQAVYVVAREDLDRWQERLGRPLPNGAFGENLTTTGLDPNTALIGERWRIVPDGRGADGPDVELQVTFGRVPCATFRGWMGERGWLKDFTADARPGAYARVVSPGTVRAGDRIEVVGRPDHDVTVALAFRAVLTHREELPRLRAAWEFLDDEIRGKVDRSEGYVLDD